MKEARNSNSLEQEKKSHLIAVRYYSPTTVVVAVATAIASVAVVVAVASVAVVLIAIVVVPTTWLHVVVVGVVAAVVHHATWLQLLHPCWIGEREAFVAAGHHPWCWMLFLLLALVRDLFLALHLLMVIHP